MTMLIDIFERLLPQFADRLYAGGVERELLANSLNGLTSACLILVLTAVLVFAFRKRILQAWSSVEGDRAFTVVVALLSVLSLPDPVFPVRPGLDYSWQWMLNRLAFGGDWGVSVVFTYGPLGWLLYPSGRWITVVAALCANVSFCALWAWCLRRIYLSSESGRITAWGLVLTMFIPQMSMEWRWTVLAIVLTRVSWLAAGMVAGVLALVKFSSLVMITASHFFVLVLGAGRRVRNAVNYAIGYIAMFALLSALCFPSPAAFWNWLVGSVQIASGYNTYMIFHKSMFELILPIAALLVVVHRPRQLLAVMPLAPLLYCAMKYGWVRQGPESFLYVLVVAAAFLMGRSVCTKRHFAIIAAFAILFGYVRTWPYYFAGGQTYIAFPFGVNPMGVVRSLSLHGTMQLAKARSVTLLANASLPAEFRHAIGSSTVQLLPYEFSPAMADPTLCLVPYATMQMYSTYTVYLDELAARSYYSDRAPEFIVMDEAGFGFDNKVAALDSPRTWAAIRANYSICNASDDGRYLLRRRRSPIPIVSDFAIDVPEESAWDKVHALFFRGKMYYVDIKTADGTCKRCRINPSVLRNPVERDLPIETKDIRRYFEGGSAQDNRDSSH